MRIFDSNVMCIDIDPYSALKECDDGTYGYNCINNCSGHCLDDYPCNKETGRCDVGCKPGYTTDNCSKGNCIIIYTFHLNSFNVLTPVLTPQ